MDNNEKDCLQKCSYQKKKKNNNNKCKKIDFFYFVRKMVKNLIGTLFQEIPQTNTAMMQLK
jgi:hypothetical protein